MWIIISLIIVFGVFVSIFGQNRKTSARRLDDILKRFTGKSLSYTSNFPITRTDIALDTVVTITVYGVDKEKLGAMQSGEHDKEIVQSSEYDKEIVQSSEFDKMDQNGMDYKQLKSSEDVAKIIDKSFELVKKYEKKFSAYEEDSEIYKLNHAAGETVEISEDTYELLGKGLYYSKLSGGRFDITCGALNELWHMSDNDGFIPSKSEIEKALSTINYEKVDIKKVKDNNEKTNEKATEQNDKVKEKTTEMNDKADERIKDNTSQYKYFAELGNPDARIDLGAIAKGYIGDKIKEYMTDMGVNSAIINLGGNVVLIGGKDTENSLTSDINDSKQQNSRENLNNSKELNDSGNFNIGIPKPFEIDKIEFSLSEKDKTIVTSGNYQRYFEKDGRIYHHIMDLETGYPVESGVSSVSIVCDSSVDADALSTICFILGRNEGEKFLTEHKSDAKAYWIE